MNEIKGKYTTAYLTLDNFEFELIKQVYNMVNHTAFDKKIVIMIDGHKGASSPIGFTMPMSKKIIPQVISVDIGCGVLSAKIGNKINVPFEILEKEVRKYIPMGFNVNETKTRPGHMPDFSFEKQFPWDDVNDTLNKFFTEYNQKFGYDFKPPIFDYRYFIERYNKEMKFNVKRVMNAISSMGGNNHFIEFGKSKKTGEYWVTVHTGSRNFGKLVCDYHTDVAKRELKYKRKVILNNAIEDIIKNSKDKTKIPFLIKKEKEKLGIDFNVSLKGLEYLEGDAACEYLTDMVFAQKYASFNRHQIIRIIFELLGDVKIKDEIESIHNYIDFKDFIIRKGAIRSYVGEKMVIPLTMEDGVVVCEGKSNPEWNNSCNHGSGRICSRSKSKELFSVEEYKKRMKNVYTTSISEKTIDESPMSYKNTNMILKEMEATATILDSIVPIINIKNKGEKPDWKNRNLKRKTEKR